ncbi:MAG: hypothetical protein AB7L09_01245 [Nitrospira sp.]
MSRFVVKCPKCDYKESVVSSKPGAALPPCPRCEEFVRMQDITPDPGQTTTVISTVRPSSPQSVDGELPKTPTAPPQPKRRDMRDYGPEPRA